MKVKLLILFLALCVRSKEGEAQTGMYIPSMQTVDDAVDNFMAAWDLPGGSIAIAKDGRLIYARGFGYARISDNTLAQPYHKFRIASISKPITAVAIFKLIDDGLLNLGDKVFGSNGILNDTGYLNINDPRYNDITIRQLLSHTAGWIRYGNDIDPMFSPVLIANYWGVPAPANQEQIIKYMLTQTLEYSPGTQQAYSNFGYCVLGRVIEKLSGQTYDQYVTDNIINAAGLSSCEPGDTYEIDKKINEVNYYDIPNAPLVASCTGQGMVAGPYGGFNIEAMDAHGGWICTAAELLKFALAIDGSPTRPDIISQSSVDSMSSYPPADNVFCHGWQKYGTGRYHTGLLNGSSGVVDIRDNGLSMAALFNSHSLNGNFLQNMLTTIWNGVYASSSFPPHDLFDFDLSASQASANDNEVIVFPNPASTTIRVTRIGKQGKLHYALYDMPGRKIASGLTEESSIDVQAIAEGQYILEVSSLVGTFYKRVIIER